MAVSRQALDVAALGAATTTARDVDAGNDPAAVDESLYLIGRPTLKQFLRFMRHQAVDPPEAGDLTAEWNAAHAYAKTLEKEEAGAADNPPLETLQVTPEHEPLLVECLKDPLVRGGFNTVPTEIAYVDLDRLVVYQHHIDLTYVELLSRQLGAPLDAERIFRACLLHDHPRPPIKWARLHRDSYVFVSPSNDLRFLGTMKLKRGNIRNYDPPGDLAAVLGLAVGFGSNFMNAIYAEGRLILNNGSHRAYALRQLGITRAPCIVQHVSSREELDMVAADEVMERPDYYLKHPRPSMLKDYFNPKLRRITPVHRRNRQIVVKFSVDEGYVPAF
jgi:hypothetical protein